MLRIVARIISAVSVGNVYYQVGVRTGGSLKRSREILADVFSYLFISGTNI